MVSAETGRHNLVTERETARHNFVSENDTRSHYERQDDTARRNVEELGRHNLVTEQQAVANLEETARHNRATENLGYGELNETTRSHKANEANVKRGQNVNAKTSVATTKINAKTSRANAKTAAAANRYGAKVNAYTAELQNAFNKKKLSQDKVLKLKEYANKLDVALANNDAEKVVHAAKNIANDLKESGVTGQVYKAAQNVASNFTNGFNKFGKWISTAISNFQNTEW